MSDVRLTPLAAGSSFPPATQQPSNAPQSPTAKAGIQAKLKLLIQEMTSREELDALLARYQCELLDRVRIHASINQTIFEKLLRRAAKENNVDDLRILIPYVKTLDAQDLDEGKVTALHLAATNGRCECYELLAALGAKETICDRNGQTPQAVLEGGDAAKSSAGVYGTPTMPDDLIPHALRQWLAKNDNQHCQKNSEIVFDEALRAALYDNNFLILKMLVAEAERVNYDILPILTAPDASKSTLMHSAAGLPDCYLYLLSVMQNKNFIFVDSKDKNGNTSQDLYIKRWEVALRDYPGVSEALSPAAKLDAAWVATLAHLKLPDITITEIKNTLKKVRTNTFAEQQEEKHEAIRAAAREKIAWLIIMDNYRFFLNKTVLIGMLFAALITAALVVTGAASVPSFLVGVAIVAGGALVGASVKRFAASQRSYRFGLFTEPAELSNPEVEKTALVAPKAPGVC